MNAIDTVHFRLSADECRAIMLGIRAAKQEIPAIYCHEHGVYDAEDWEMLRESGRNRYSVRCNRHCDVVDTHWAGGDLEDSMACLRGHERAVAEHARKLARRNIEAQARQDRDDDLRARGEG